MSATDQETRAVVLKAAMNAELPASAAAYEVDEVPGTTGGPGNGTTPTRYVTYELSRRWHPERRGDADVIPGWALTTHYRAPSVSDVRELRRCIVASLENRAFDLPDGDTFGPFSFEFDGGIEFIAGAWSGFDTWTA